MCGTSSWVNTECGSQSLTIETDSLLYGILKKSGNISRSSSFGDLRKQTKSARGILAANIAVVLYLIYNSRIENVRVDVTLQ